MNVFSTGGMRFIDLGLSGALSFRVVDGDVMVMVMSLRPANTRGEEILRIVDGHVREGADPNVRFESRTGQIEVIAPLTPEYQWRHGPSGRRGQRVLHRLRCS